MITKVYKILLKEFGPRGWWPINGKYSAEFKNKIKSKVEKFEICAGAILTQSTNWKNVEKALDEMRKKGLISRDKLIQIDEKELARIIKPAGYHNQKAKKLKEFAKFKGDVTRENLLDIWGIGPETADSILLYAYDQPFFVVDAYTKRIFSRLGMCDAKDNYEKIQKMFHENLEKDFKIFNEYHALLVELGKRNCKTKPICETCVLRKICKNQKT